MLHHSRLDYVVKIHISLSTSRRLIGQANITICEEDSSREVAQFYMERRYDSYENCELPCSEMRVELDSKYKEEDNNNMTVIILEKEIDLFKEHRLESWISLG